MTVHPYSLRSRLSSSSLTSKTPAQSPSAKLSKSPRKGASSISALLLKHVIGTTTSTPGGLSCCAASNSYSYCAGSVVVLATINANNSISYRYFKARPTALPINPSASFYDSASTSNTPTRRRATVVQRRGYEDYGSNTPNRDWLDEGGGQTWSARERIKAASCVSISPDGRILAVGEIGYNPRVLLFSTAENMPPDAPLSIITDHTIGVRSVAFSPNSKYLATLGDVNDGFLYIWQVNTKNGVLKLHSSNKCTTNVCDMTWCGNNVITVGTRHIKVWQASGSVSNSSNRQAYVRHESEAPSSGPAPLQGRNCLLGALVDATFTAVVALSEDQAVVCADDGHICLLDLRHGKTELSTFERTQSTIAAICLRENPCRLIWAGGGERIEERDFSLLQGASAAQQTDVTPADARRRRRRISRQSLLRQSLGLSPPKRAHTVALGCIKENVVSIDADGMIRVSRIDTYNSEQDICTLASHNGPVRGTRVLPKEAGLGSFFTWARSGEIRFWDSIGALIRVKVIELDQNLDTDDVAINELKVVRYSGQREKFVVGDQFGVLRVFNAESWDCVQTVRAHSAEINDIDVHELSSTVASCSRDRMVQIFVLRVTGMELLQTCDDHISAVSQVLFNDDGNRLLSCSSDRTIVIRERVERNSEHQTVSAFISVRTITMKATPLSMSFVPMQPDTLVVSTSDRQILKVNIAVGTTMTSFKVSDRESDETVMLNSICIGSIKTVDGRCLLAGYSAIDKSVRMYDLEKGTLLGRDSGHTEGISSIVMFEDESAETSSAQMAIVSTGLDGTIMLWSATGHGQPFATLQQELSQAQALGIDPEKMYIKASPASLPPLRRVLSKMDIAEFVGQSSPTREASPNGLRRKTSRLALNASIEEADERPSSKLVRTQSQELKTDPNTRSPSPPAKSLVKPRKQRSRSEMNKGVDAGHARLRQSPSPPTGLISAPTTPKYNARANNSRLRRPPSVPNDLRAQAAAHGRRQSVNTANDFGSMGMATEQACRMLKQYSKKLQASKDDLNLDEIEADLETLLRTVKQKKTMTSRETRKHGTQSMKGDANDVMNGLSALIERTSVS